MGVIFGLYSSICVYIAPAMIGTSVEWSLGCYVVGASFPVLDLPVIDDVVVTSAVIALALSIVSVGLGRLLHNRINTPLME